MNSKVCSEAGREAISDEQIANLWDCSEREGETVLDGYAREIRFARSLLASGAAVQDRWRGRFGAQTVESMACRSHGRIARRNCMTRRSRPAGTLATIMGRAAKFALSTPLPSLAKPRGHL
jgi:hypothetical protein